METEKLLRMFDEMNAKLKRLAEDVSLMRKQQDTTGKIMDKLVVSLIDCKIGAKRRINELGI